MAKDNARVQTLTDFIPQHDKLWFKVPHLLRLNLLLLIPLISSSVCGFDGSLMNGLQSVDAWKSYFGNPQGQVLGAVNAGLSCGSIVGLPLAGFAADKWGRKITLALGAIVVIVASAIQAGSVDLGMFIFARVLTGIGSVLTVQPAPLLLSEVCYPTHRGKYTALYWTMFYLGSIIAAWTCYGTQKHMAGSEWSWRIPSIVQAACPIIQLTFIYWVPESPRWLIANGRHAEATEILEKYHAGGEKDHPLVKMEIVEISGNLQNESKAKGSWSTLIATPANRKRIFITIMLGFYSQWTGSSVVSYYLTLVLDTIGITNPETQTLINGILQIFNLACALVASFLVDRLGRRVLWNWSGIGMCLSFVIWTICSALFDKTSSSSLGTAVLAFIFIFYFHYDIAYTPLVIAYPTEILPYNMRSRGISVELLAIYGSQLALSFINPVALDSIGWRYYIVFACVSAFSVITNWVLLPETKGYSLEEISQLFDDEPIGDEETEAKGKIPEKEITHIDDIGSLD
ncbi:general substrate transporter [Penicillium odoratum]|uniref:general substrate transporter n=1 Tax=Penicillium odoratum TaxID=1167516 RepID=UPI00254932F2|nr:general substrate transporter [Penicillium odoratum]KAJ5759006.1 general substrate transporter [Penicillium odoratum]